jgi:hypothetical protein
VEALAVAAPADQKHSFLLLQETSTPFHSQPTLPHSCPDFLCIVPCIRHFIRGGAALKIQAQDAPSKMRLSNEVEIDCGITGTILCRCPFVRPIIPVSVKRSVNLSSLER